MIDLRAASKATASQKDAIYSAFGALPNTSGKPELTTPSPLPASKPAHKYSDPLRPLIGMSGRPQRRAAVLPG